MQRIVTPDLIRGPSSSGVVDTEGGCRIKSGMTDRCRAGRPVSRRRTAGGAGPDPVARQLQRFERRLEVDAERLGESSE